MKLYEPALALLTDARLTRAIAAQQEIQKRNPPTSAAWQQASDALAPLCTEMALRHASETVTPAPTAPAASKSITSSDPALPYFAVWFAPQRKWIRALNLLDMVAEFCASRDWADFGAADIGGTNPIYLMNASGTQKRKIGLQSYNGNVQLDQIP